MIEFIKTKKWALSLSALCVIPFLAFQAMKVRTGTVLLADVPELKVITYSSGRVDVHYADGTTLPADGLGIEVITWAEYRKTESQYGADVTAFLVQSDFPAVFFYNASGFDVSGEVVSVRRGSDGKQRHANPKAIKRVAWVTAQPGGAFRVTHADRSVLTVSEADWYKDYMGMAKEEPAKEIKETKETKETKPALKTGVRGRIFKVGALSIGEPLAVAIYAFAGKTEPFAKEGGKLPRDPLATTSSAKDGSFELPLPPGTYTLVAEIEGQLRGNAVNPKVWPSVDVKDGWTDYEFRVQP